MAKRGMFLLTDFYVILYYSWCGQRGLPELDWIIALRRTKCRRNVAVRSVPLLTWLRISQLLLLVQYILIAML